MIVRMAPNIFQLVTTITLKRGDSIPLDDLPDKTMTPPFLLLFAPLLLLVSKRAWHRRRRVTGDGDLLIIMSATATEGEAAAVRAAEVVCAWCGIAAVDNITLEECDGCDLVKYCSDKCQEGHVNRSSSYASLL